MSEQIDITVVKKKKEEGFTYKSWYEKNKEKLSEKRKRQYQENAEYREKAVVNSKKNYWNRRAEEGKIDEALPKLEELVPLIVTDPDNGSDMVMYTVRHIAQLLGRQEQTINIWLKKGYMKTPSYTKGRNRLFTKEETEIIYSCRDLMQYPYKSIDTWVFFVQLNERLEEVLGGDSNV